MKLSPEDIVDLSVAQSEFAALKKQRRAAKKNEDAEMKNDGIEVVDLEDPAEPKSPVASDKEDKTGKVDGIMSTAMN